MIINLSKEDAQLKTVLRKTMGRLCVHDCDFAGITVRFKSAEHTSVDCGDAILGAQVTYVINCARDALTICTDCDGTSRVACPDCDRSPMIDPDCATCSHQIWDAGTVACHCAQTA